MVTNYVIGKTEGMGILYFKAMSMISSKEMEQNHNENPDSRSTSGSEKERGVHRAVNLPASCYGFQFVMQ
jgi:hypothetical protein